MSPASTGRDLPGTEGPASAPRAGFGGGAGGVEGQAGEHFVADSGAVHGGVQVLVVCLSGGFEGGTGTNKLEVRPAGPVWPGMAAVRVERFGGGSVS